MRRMKAVVAMGLLTIALAACSDDPASACFKKGEHDTMSDGRITRICDCALKRVGVGTLSEAERSTLVDVILGRSVSADQEARYRSTAARWNPAMQSCKVQP